MGPEFKPGLFPSEYIVPPAKEGKLGILAVLDGQRTVYLDQDRGSESVVVSGTDIANSIVNDYIFSQPGQDQNSGPGMFWVRDVLGEEAIRRVHASEIEKATTMQREWWRRLVRLADDAWQVDHKLAQIGDLDRIACRELGLKRDWLDDNPDMMTKCPVCTTLISTSAIVCFACHVVLKPEEYKKFQFAGGPVQPLNAKA